MREDRLSLKPLDLSNMLQHAFLSGRDSQKGTGQTRMEAWAEYDPTENDAYLRIEAILKNFDSTRPEAAQVRVEDLDERMKAAGMIPLSELLESHGPMEKFKQHAAVKTFDDFVWWIKSQQKQFMTMRMQYELGDKDKSDDLFEWVFAHAAVYDQIATQLRALEPDTVTDQLSRSIADFVSRQEPLGAEFEQVLADNIEELYETQPDTAADTVTGWQDISTAPKDGTPFLMGWPDYVTELAMWDIGSKQIVRSVWQRSSKAGAEHTPDPLDATNAKWMPLPPAPEKEE